MSDLLNIIEKAKDRGVTWGDLKRVYGADLCHYRAEEELAQLEFADKITIDRTNPLMTRFRIGKTVKAPAMSNDSAGWAVTGSMLCKRCDKRVKRTSFNQKYCAECAPKQHRKRVREHYRRTKQ